MVKYMEKTLENNLKRYECLISIWTRWDESFWTSFNMFVIITGFIFAGFAQIYQIGNVNLTLVFCFAGIVISILWLLTLNRKLVHLTCAENEGRKLEGEFYNKGKEYGCFTSTKKFADRTSKERDQEYITKIEDILGRKKIFTRVGTGTIIACYFPIAMIAIWIILGMLISSFLLSSLFLLFSIFFLIAVSIVYLLFSHK